LSTGLLLLPFQEGNDGKETDLPSQSKDENLRGESIIWGHGKTSFLPGGNFNILSALTLILLNQGEVGRNRYFTILNDHFERENNSDIWKALLLILRTLVG
jgi:hypothetical protein